VSRISVATAPEGVQAGRLKSSTGQDVVEVAGQLDGAAMSAGALSEVMPRSHVPGTVPFPQDGARVIRGNVPLPLIVPRSYPGGEAPGS
jgi:hypothetical protein